MLDFVSGTEWQLTCNIMHSDDDAGHDSMYPPRYDPLLKMQAVAFCMPYIYAMNIIG